MGCSKSSVKNWPGTDRPSRTKYPRALDKISPGLGQNIREILKFIPVKTGSRIGCPHTRDNSLTLWETPSRRSKFDREPTDPPGQTIPGPNQEYWVCYSPIIHIGEVVREFFCCFCFVWIVVSNRGCCFCSGLGFLFGVDVGFGGCFCFSKSLKMLRWKGF